MLCFDTISISQYFLVLWRQEVSVFFAHDQLFEAIDQLILLGNLVLRRYHRVQLAQDMLYRVLVELRLDVEGNLPITRVS